MRQLRFLLPSTVPKLWSLGCGAWAHGDESLVAHEERAEAPEPARPAHGVRQPLLREHCHLHTHGEWFSDKATKAKTLSDTMVQPKWNSQNGAAKMLNLL